MIAQEREEHMEQLAEAVRHIFPCLGYTPQAIERFIQTPDSGTDEGEFYRIETAPDRAVLTKLRSHGDDGRAFPYLIPTAWSGRYQALWSALECLKKISTERGIPELFMCIQEEIPSHNAYFGGLLGMQGFKVKPRVLMEAPLDVLDTRPLPALPEGIVEVEVTEDRLKQAANSHHGAFVAYDEAPLPAEEDQRYRDDNHRYFLRLFKNHAKDVKNWVMLEHQGDIMAICFGFNDPPFLVIEEMSVHPVYRGQGLGRYICLRCMQKLRDAYGGPDKRFQLGTNLTWTPAVKLYHWLGFTIETQESYAEYRYRLAG